MVPTVNLRQRSISQLNVCYPREIIVHITELNSWLELEDNNAAHQLYIEEEEGKNIYTVYRITDDDIYSPLVNLLSWKNKFILYLYVNSKFYFIH